MLYPGIKNLNYYTFLKCRLVKRKTIHVKWCKVTV